MPRYTVEGDWAQRAEIFNETKQAWEELKHCREIDTDRGYAHVFEEDLTLPRGGGGFAPVITIVNGQPQAKLVVVRGLLRVVAKDGTIDGPPGPIDLEYQLRRQLTAAEAREDKADARGRELEDLLRDQQSKLLDLRTYLQAKMAAGDPIECQEVSKVFDATPYPVAMPKAP